MTPRTPTEPPAFARFDPPPLPGWAAANTRPELDRRPAAASTSLRRTVPAAMARMHHLESPPAALLPARPAPTPTPAPSLPATALRIPVGSWATAAPVLPLPSAVPPPRAAAPSPRPPEQSRDHPAPRLDADRIAELDFLRGFALLGVMLMNIPHFSGWVYMGETSLLSTVLNAIAHGKFISIFSMLFGFGIAMQLDRRSDGGLQSFTRRHVALLVIGLAHAALLFSGDILVSYAITAFVSLLFLRCSVVALVRWAGALWVLGTVWTLAEVRSAWSGGFSKAQVMEVMTNIQTYLEGSYSDVVAVRWAETIQQLSSLPTFLPQLVGTFLLGMAAARAGLFTGGAIQERALVLFRTRVLPIALVLSAACAYVTHTSEGPGASYGQVLLLAVAPLHAIGYVGLFTAVYRAGTGGLRERVSTLGRMGLTNYLLHSVVFGSVYYGYAGGQYMQLGYAESVLLALATYAAMLVASTWWLTRCRFGPAEWVLRSVTYGGAQRMRR